MGRSPRLIDRMVATAARHSDRPALTFLARGERSAYTFGQLFETVEPLARRMKAAPIDPSLPVGILLQTQEEQVVHYLAALLAGAVPAILTPPNRKLNRAYYLKTMAGVLDQSGFTAWAVHRTSRPRATSTCPTC